MDRTLDPISQPGAPHRPRVPYLDALRCLAICLVILLHVTAPVMVSPTLYQSTTWLACMVLDPLVRVGVPLFLMISGNLMLGDPRSKAISPFYKKQLPKLLIPLAVWNVIYFAVSVLTGSQPLSLLAFLQAALNQGTKYHMWYIYMLVGIYLICPYLRRLVETCTPKQLLLLFAIILLPSTLRPAFNQVLPFSVVLFGPMLEGLVGYFLLGWLLGQQELSRRARYLIYLGGAAGYAVHLVGNLLYACPQQSYLPFESGYAFPHYLIAAALFVWIKTFFSRRGESLHPLQAPLRFFSQLAFGVYWVHPLVLDVITHLEAGRLPLAPALGLRFVLTALVSFLFAACVARIPILRRLLQ